jgi:hypothetical protein
LLARLLAGGGAQRVRYVHSLPASNAPINKQKARPLERASFFSTQLH